MNDKKLSAEEQVKEHAKYTVGSYVACGHKSTKGIFWKLKLQTALATHFAESNIGIPKSLKEQLGDSIANNIYRDETARIISNKALLDDAVIFFKNSGKN